MTGDFKKRVKAPYNNVIVKYMWQEGVFTLGFEILQQSTKKRILKESLTLVCGQSLEGREREMQMCKSEKACH